MKRSIRHGKGGEGYKGKNQNHPLKKKGKRNAEKITKIPAMCLGKEERIEERKLSEHFLGEENATKSMLP